MTRSFLTICLAGALFLQTACNNDADKKTEATDTTTVENTPAGPDRRTNDPAPASNANQKEYNYEQTAMISGKITKETFYGAPGFGENPDTDPKVESYLLVLDQPINVIGDANPEDDSKESKYNVSKIQLIYDEKAIDMGRHLGSTVQLSGTLFGAHTGHHHTPVLMDVTGLKAL